MAAMALIQRGSLACGPAGHLDLQPQDPFVRQHRYQVCGLPDDRRVGPKPLGHLLLRTEAAPLLGANRHHHHPGG
jgi:hypothetical protein